LRATAAASCHGRPKMRPTTTCQCRSDKTDRSRHPLSTAARIRTVSEAAPHCAGAAGPRRRSRSARRVRTPPGSGGREATGVRRRCARRSRRDRGCDPAGRAAQRRPRAARGRRRGRSAKRAARIAGAAPPRLRASGWRRPERTRRQCDRRRDPLPTAVRGSTGRSAAPMAGAALSRPRAAGRRRRSRSARRVPNCRGAASEPPPPCCVDLAAQQKIRSAIRVELRRPAHGLRDGGGASALVATLKP